MDCALRVATFSFPSVALILGVFASAHSAEQLTPEQAALCSHLQNQMQSLDKAHGKHAERVAHTRRLIEEQGELLNGMKEGLDQSDAASVKAYNENVDQYARTIKRYNNELLPELERLGSAFNAKVRAYNKDCAGKEVR